MSDDVKKVIERIMDREPVEIHEEKSSREEIYFTQEDREYHVRLWSVTEEGIRWTLYEEHDGLVEEIDSGMNRGM